MGVEAWAFVLWGYLVPVNNARNLNTAAGI